MKIFFLLAALVAIAGAAVMAIVLIDMADLPGAGIMTLSFHISLLALFTGLAVYFFLRIFLGNNVLTRVLILVTALATTTFAGMFMYEIIDTLILSIPSSLRPNFRDSLQILFLPISNVVIGLITLFVALSKFSKRSD